MYQDVTNEGLATLSVPNKRVSGSTMPTMYRVKVMFAEELSLEFTPSSRVIKLKSYCHFSHKLASLLNCAIKTNRE